jgi:hypothetical protein
VQGVILGYLDSIEPGCDLIAVGGGAIDDWAHTLADQRVVIDVLLNDAASDCDGNFEPVIESFDEVSAEGGVVKLVGGVGFWTELAYTPAAGFSGQDSFTYTLVEGGTAEVIVSVDWLRPPDDVDGLSPGAAIEYFALESPQVLPDFDALSPYYDDVLPQIGIVSTDGPFATSGRFDEVGAVVTGYLSIPETGLYTLSIESDDGSRLSIGGSLVIDNDGLHGMVERFGTIGLMAGMHEIRIDFFENGGNAGLIARFQGPGIQRQTIPSWVWFHGEAAEPCPEDVNGDGVVDVGDLLAVIDSWGDCDNCSADVDGSGSVGADDLLAVIARWNQVC